MEIVKQDPSISCDNVCYLNCMPCDILNFIAHFLTCDDETEEQFVERTQGKKQQLDPYADEEILQAFYDDGSDNLVSIYLFCVENDFHGHQLVISEEGDPYDFYNGALESAEYRCIALFGRKMALFYYTQIDDVKKSVLELQRIDLKKNKKDPLNGIINLGEKRELSPLVFEPTYIAFNQQGTHLIAHGKNPITQKATHTIFPFKEVVVRTNRLQKYLRNKVVCNTYIEGKK